MKTRIAAGIAAPTSLSLSLATAVAFFQLYWRNRDCFDESGRCFVPVDGTVHGADSLFLAPVAQIFGILFVVGSLFASRR